MAKVTMRGMLEAGVHFGHQTARWNPKMKPFIYTARNGVHIINLQKTIRMWQDASRFLKSVAAHGDSVLFVATKRQAQEVVEQEALRAKMPYVTNRWLGGMMTNFPTVRKSIEKISSIEEQLSEGQVERRTKKEVLRLERLRTKLMKNLGGIREMTKVPAAIFVVDPRKEHIAISEARRLKIPVIALVDTNCDPDLVDYVIPANDDAIRGIQLFSSAVADAVLLGLEEHKEHMIRGFDGDSADFTAVDSGKEGDGPEVIRKSKAGVEEEVPAEVAVAEVAVAEVAPAEVAPAEVAPAEVAVAEEAPAADASEDKE